MSSLSAIRSSNLSALKNAHPRPVGFFVGGTSGIGAAMAQAFAAHTDGDADIVIVGRNQAAAEELLSAMPKGPSGDPAPRREFVACDATLMKDVERVTTELNSRYAKLNYLILTPGILTTKGRDETSEGIDKKMALHYYTRWRFLHEYVMNSPGFPYQR
jgi:NAD(P)-dependent dehydrogenase (short-subunit alcohol dehydrogenase family)